MLALYGYALLLPVYRRVPFLLDWQPPQRVIPVLLIPVLLGYLLFTGDAVSTRRAFALAVLGSVLLWRRYHTDPLRLLTLLALFSLWVNPLLLWHAGWQLSFAGAAGILVGRPLLTTLSGLRLLWRYPLQMLLVTASATLATAPLVLLNFHLFSPAALAANLFSIPVVTMIALPAGLTALLLFPWAPLPAGWLLSFCGSCLEYLLDFNSWLLSVPGWEAKTLFLAWPQHLALGLVVFPLFFCWRLRVSRLRLFLLLFCFTGAGICWQLPVGSSAPVTLTMISVGQGDSFLLQNAAGQAVLIDGGGLYSERFDVGERLVAPTLGQMRVTELAAVVLSHDHPDHRKGLVYILDHFPVGEFWSESPMADLDQQLQEVLVRKGVPFRQAPSGWSRVAWWKGNYLGIYNGALPGMSKNDSSLVVYCRPDGAEGLLLTGDLEEQGTVRLLAAGVPGPVGVLKLPHHGSRFSASDQLVDHFKPRACLVSVGYGNRYHLPAGAVVNLLQDRNLPLYRSDRDGTVQARLTSRGWEFRRWSRGLFR